MPKFKVQGILVKYYENKEIEADDETDATYKYYLDYKAGNLEVVNDEWDIIQKEEI